METCEVLVIGGGPAGSTCAGKLVQAGVDVLLLDKETFPREKPCAGWITPAVFAALGLDADEYRQGRVLQEINSFRTGLINGVTLMTDYGATVSYGIRRYEFDNFLLQRSRVRRQLGHAVTTLDWKDGWWLVNGNVRARLLVGGGGHFCPVARRLGACVGREEVVAAQAAECAMTPAEERQCRIKPETPELFFCRDMKGYGWLFRKGNWLNLGLGRREARNLSRHTGDFRTFVEQLGGVPEGVTGRLRGHAYRLYGREGRRSCVGEGALLIGDAAGVANPDSGEGILPSIESALLAAEVIVAAGGEYRSDNLMPYAERLNLHLGSLNPRLPSSQVSSEISCYLGTKLLSNSWFTRHVVLDRWFLRR